MRPQRRILKEAPRYRGFYTCDYWRGYVHDTEAGRATAISLGATHFDPLTFHRLDPGGKPAPGLWGCFFYKFRASRTFKKDVVDFLCEHGVTLDDGDVCVIDGRDGSYDLYLSPRLFLRQSPPYGLPETYNAVARRLAGDLSLPGSEVQCVKASLIPANCEDIHRRPLSFGSDVRAPFGMQKPHPRKPPTFPPISALINERGGIACGVEHSNDGVRCALMLETRFRQKGIEEFTQRDALRAADGTFTLDRGVEEALRLLEATGHIVRCPDLTPRSPGRRSTWFLVNPEVLRQGSPSIYDGSALIPHEKVGEI